MNVIIATGDRYATAAQWEAIVRAALIQHIGTSPAIVYHGACGLDEGNPKAGPMKGIDRIVHDLASRMPDVEVVAIPANWTRDKLAGGPIRNGVMTTRGKQHREAGDLVTCLAFHDQRDLLTARKGGTSDMVRRARGAQFPVTWYRSSGEREVVG